MNRSLVKVIAAAAVIGASGCISAVAVAAQTEAAVTIPNNSVEIWKAIDGHMQQLHAVIAQGKLNTVHEHAFAVRDLVRALPTHSPNVPADALAQVTAQSKFVDTLAQRLDQTGDANDKPGTEDNTRKLEALLKTLRAQYP